MDSMYHLANLLLLHEPLTQSQITNAQEWLEKCANKGHAEAADSAAKLYEGNVDYMAALKWYQIAKKNGHPEAEENIVSTQRKMSQHELKAPTARASQWVGHAQKEWRTVK